MATSYRRNSTVVQTNVNLYCAQCESQIGIFDNEWIRLTTSYARSKEKGTHFGTEVGHRTQVVPQGPAQRSAEGCVMAEVFCCKCSNMVGQYCKSAPDAEKRSLIDQYFYKLTRTYLKDCRTHMKVEPVFGYGSDMIKPASSRTSMFPRSSMAPTSRWADTPLRQSSSTPAISLPATNRKSSRRESRGTPVASLDTVDRKWEERWEQSSTELRNLREEMAAQRMVIQEQSDILSAQSQRLDDQETRLKDQVTCVEEHETCMSAQASHIVEQDQLIQNQTKRLEEQQVHMSAITDQLKKLQKTMDDLRSLLSSKQTRPAPRLTQSQDMNSVDLDSVMGALKNAETSVQELQSLRTENEAMKSRLHTIASAMSDISDLQRPTITNIEMSLPTSSDSVQVLGKRKRNALGRRSSLALSDRAVRFQGNTEQMLTPQASDGGQQSPEQTPFVANTYTNVGGNSNERAQSALETVQANSTSVLVDIDAVDNEDAAANNVSSQQLVLLNDDEEEDIPNPDQTSKGPARKTRGRRRSVSTTQVRRSGRTSKAREMMEAADADSETSILELVNADERRVTRSATKAPKSKTTDGSHFDQAAGYEAQPPVSLSPTSANEAHLSLVDNVDFPQPHLPSVQMASNVLGMNLEALLASSQVLRQGLDVPKEDAESAMATILGGENVTANIPQRAINIDSLSKPQSIIDNNQSDVGGDADTPLEQSSQVEFVQDASIFDVIDTSDDDDDLMQPDTALYGEDSLDTGNIQLPEREDPSVIDRHRITTSHHDGPTTAASRTGRSMAPEPMKAKRKPAVRSLISLDKIHIATPQMFTEAYANGRQPKAARPPPIQARERTLNEELKQLGLSEWIGKNKNTKEYRDLVTAARARFRNFQKAAFLRSKGFSYDLSDPSSTLPEGAAQRTASASQIMPLADIQNVPGPAHSMANEPERTGADADEEEQVSKDQPRATRARTRRSSVPLVSGLEEGGSQPTRTPVKQSVRKRKSVGNQKTARSSGIAPQKEDTRTQIDHPDNNADNTADEISTDVATITTTISDKNTAENAVERGAKRRKSSGRPRVASAKPAAVNLLSEKRTDQQEQVRNGKPVPSDVQLSSTPMSLPVAMPEISGDTTGSEKATQIPGTKTQAQRREEAILLRDRMAKELMEREMMEL